MSQNSATRSCIAFVWTTSQTGRDSSWAISMEISHSSCVFEWEILIHPGRKLSAPSGTRARCRSRVPGRVDQDAVGSPDGTGNAGSGCVRVSDEREHLFRVRAEGPGGGPVDPKKPAKERPIGWEESLRQIVPARLTRADRGRRGDVVDLRSVQGIPVYRCLMNKMLPDNHFHALTRFEWQPL